MTSLSQWTQRISEKEMPILAHTAQEIAMSSEREDSSSAEIAHIILQDSSMTARVLKLANSTYFNPAGHAIRTISRGRRARLRRGEEPVPVDRADQCTAQGQSAAGSRDGTDGAQLSCRDP
ncbi:MAG: HDOD domain-containing protein, partial [Ectothiorhodospiraceae bacterium]|nr:HDOD domain-containing protein [Ectothiorhodospiraceae bacterium]